jgi:hypothetical protein
MRLPPERAEEVFGRGVLPVRRSLAPESVDLVDKLVGRIVSNLPVRADVFDRHRFGVTVVALSRFDASCHYDHGPATCEVAQDVDSTRDELEANRGKLMIVGGWPEYKLATRVASHSLKAEEAAFCQAFADHGFPLGRTGEAPKFKYNPHITIAELGRSKRPFDNATLRELSNIGGMTGRGISLEPDPVCFGQEQRMVTI